MSTIPIFIFILMRKINQKFAGVSNQAFTLIEVVMAITLITIVMTAVYGLVISIITANQRNIHSLQASALAAEGLEVVRFMRDSNWLQNYEWDKGGAAGGFNFEVDSSTHTTEEFYLEESTSSPYWSLSAAAISDGMFTRKISISEVDPDAVDSQVYEVLSTVSWKERGVDRNVEVSTFLTDWHD